MRPIMVTILGFIILLTISLVAYYHINQTSIILQVELAAAEQKVLAEDWEQTQLIITDIQQKWSRYKTWWAIFLNHATLSNVDIALVRLQQFALAQNSALSLAELHTLLVILKDIPQSELLRVYNIL